MANVTVETSVASDTAVTKLASLAVLEISKSLKSGTNASVALAATLIADEVLNGNNALGKRKLMQSIKQSMLNRGEKAGSFATYNRIAQSLVALYRAEIMGAILALQSDGRNAPLTAREIFDAVYAALGKVPGLMDSYTALKAATIGGVPQSEAEKARAKVRNLATALNKLADVDALKMLGELATMRAVALGKTGSKDLESIKEETRELCERIAKFYGADTDAVELAEDEEAA